MRIAVFLCWFALLLPAQSLESLAKAYRDKPSPQRRAALIRFAETHPKDINGALALFAVAVTDIEAGKFDEGAKRLEAAGPRLSRIADYVSFHLGAARAGLKDYAGAAAQLELVCKQSPPSPLARRAVLLAAKALLDSGAPQRAAGILTTHYERLPQPEAGLALAKALEAAGNLPVAAEHYQRVYYGFPASPEASEAGTALERMKVAMGASYPPPMPAVMLERAEKLLEAGLYPAARAEYQALARELTGSEREIALVGAGAADYLRGQTRAARDYLESLRTDSKEAGARRLYYLVACTRRLGEREKMLEFVDMLGRNHPQSEWRMRALIWAANDYLLSNNPERYEPLFRACYEAFPSHARSAYCHWKVAWNAYLRRDPKAADLLRQHLSMFPGGENRTAALYFLGRLAEKSGDGGAARRNYEAAARTSPQGFYGTLARRRIAQGRFAQPQHVSSQEAAELHGAAGAVDFSPTSGTQYRIGRARLLALAGMPLAAEGELRFGAENGGQAHVLAMELARSASRRGEHGMSLRYIKGVFPGYLSLPPESAPTEFWRLAFPVPFRRELERYCRAHELDLWLVAGLIRQESEFDPKAVSRAGARGLMQVMPSTGRNLSRRLGVRNFGNAMLITPDFNIRLGTYYFRSLLNELDGQLEAALASYNGGMSRVVQWLTWASFEEPAEFIETIPISETRNYVQAVLRNAEIYRRLYVASR